MTSTSSLPSQVDVLIIGAGFGGIGLGVRLLQTGRTDFAIVEKAAEVGGCWRDNTYPGAACDVPSHLYSFSFAPNTAWSRRYAPQAEIHAYIKACVTRFSLSSHIHTGCEVASAIYDEGKQRWQVVMLDGSTVSARVLVSACGQLNRPAWPTITGAEHFAGVAFHSAQWRHDVDLRGKRVAVIGAGASAIQFVPQLVQQAAHVTVFQRTAPYVIAKPDIAYTQAQQQRWQRWPWWQRLSRKVQYLAHESRALAFVKWPWLMKFMRFQFTQHLQRQVADADLRAKLTPDYPLGCKRILISNDYYPALTRSNAALETLPISQITPHGVQTADGREHVADVLIYGTGFAATEFLAPMQIRGRAGLELTQAWRGGAEAFKGLTVAGFPNFFLLYGPNTNLGHSSIIYMLESQFNYVLSALEQMQRLGISTLEVKAAPQAQFNQALTAALQGTVWAQGCSSWYINESGKQTNNWPGFTFSYRRQTRRLELNDYECTFA
ncbi:flavin-containing monooxygenase [Atopomonas sediminilitoris]|uniref:flavin-containing monooxygenase n=1 Tax=Atopomonas sediminilitoris TaxID=2919919 RepID=UPI001F4EDA9B|nr:NAD(P)/FAD-dependent oxidoreductase [Atopomonas sediminilitoris]MCJ8168922.1 NAD(P)/FAD-dependent oxidoreductase [Atopomonas sediminilitoris]